nr:hypothetical protein [uncultured Devosia sp.]
MFMTISTVGAFGFVLALGWLAIAAVMLVIPSRRSGAGWHAARAAIAILISVAMLSFASTQIYRDLGFSSWPEMIDHFSTGAR